MLYELKGRQRADIITLVQGLASHLSVTAVIEGAVKGEVWVDQPESPTSVYLITPEGQYLAGEAHNPAFVQALAQKLQKETWVNFMYDSEKWETAFPILLAGKYARRQKRLYYRLEALQLKDWRDRLPPDFQMRRVDADFLRQRHLKNFQEVEMRLDDWFGEQNFLTQGFGFCVLHEDIIATRCISDCVSGGICEIGIGTDPTYRRRGLAALTVAATVEYCLQRGLKQVGWHCLENNIGSWKTAEKVGFQRRGSFYEFSNGLPAENAGDLSRAEWQETAEFAGRAFQESGEKNARLCFQAAAGWALAGEKQAALEYLGRFQALGGGKGSDAFTRWIPTAWMFKDLWGEAGWEAWLSEY